MPDPTYTQAQQQPTTVTKITPKNPAHCLFGRVLNILRVEGEFILAKIEDGIHSIEAKFHVSQVDVVISVPVAVAPVPENVGSVKPDETVVPATPETSQPS